MYGQFKGVFLSRDALTLAFRIIERQPIECGPRVEVVDVTLKINAILLTFNSLQDFRVNSEATTFDDNTALGRSFTYKRKSTGHMIEPWGTPDVTTRS